MIGAVPYDNDWALLELETLSQPLDLPAEELAYWNDLHRHVLRREGTKDEMWFWRKDLILLRQNPKVAIIRLNPRSLVIKTERVVVDLSYTNGTVARRYLGVWGLVVQAATVDRRPVIQANLVPLETGHRNGDTPPYRYNTKPLGFCFGGREAYITASLACGAIAEAVTFMLEALWHVNKTSMPQVLSNYMATDEPLIEERR